MISAFEKEVMKVISAHKLQVGRSESEKDQLYNGMPSE